MSKVTDSFQDIGIRNVHQYARGHVMIVYCPADGAGAWREAAKWQVVRHLDHTDDAPIEARHWRDRGLKTWDVFRASEKETCLEQAKAWASEKYGVKEWAKTPYGTWMDAEFVARRNAELKARIKEAKIDG